MPDPVPVVVDGERILIDAQTATGLAACLRSSARDRVDGAAAAAEMIEAVLGDEAQEATMDDLAADAIFRELNLSISADTTPFVVSLYMAARKVHRRLHHTPS